MKKTLKIAWNALGTLGLPLFAVAILVGAYPIEPDEWDIAFAGFGVGVSVALGAMIVSRYRLAKWFSRNIDEMNKESLKEFMESEGEDMLKDRMKSLIATAAKN